MLLTTKPVSSARSSREGQDVSVSKEAHTSYRLMKQAQPNNLNLSEYINLVSGLDQKDKFVSPDHSYARPTSQHSTDFPKRCRYLFSDQQEVAVSSDDEIDVETVDTERNIPLLSLHREKALTEPRKTELASLEEDDGTSGVYKLSEDGWSPVQIRVLKKVMQIIEEVQLHYLAYKGRPNEQFLIENAFGASAQKLSYLLSSIGWDQSVVQWVHSLLTKILLPAEMKVYLSVLNSVKKKFPNLVDKVLTPAYVGHSTPVNEKPIEQLLKAVPAKSSLTDEVAEVLLDEKLETLPGDPILVVIPNCLKSSKTDRFSHFVVQLGQMASVRVVTYSACIGTTSIGAHLDQMVAETRTQLAHICSKLPKRPVILIGWYLGAAIACLAAQLEEVQGIICLGYPYMNSVCNTQESNFSIINVKCPILFVIGARSEMAPQKDMEDLRSQLTVPNQLVVFCGCNSQFIMSYKMRAKLCVTQSMVDRSLVIEIYNFVGELLRQPASSTRCRTPTTRVPKVAKGFPVLSDGKIKELSVPAQRLLRKTFVIDSRGRRPFTDVPNSPPPKRKACVSTVKKSILLTSEKHVSSLPHHNYAAKFQLQPLLDNNHRSILPHRDTSA